MRQMTIVSDAQMFILFSRINTLLRKTLQLASLIEKTYVYLILDKKTPAPPKSYLERRLFQSCVLISVVFQQRFSSNETSASY